jgi:uncharacterized protein (DUF2062 family)
MFKKLKERAVALLKLNNTPREIALGVGIGAFIAITPLYGFHTFMVVIAALLVRRANKIAMLIGTNVSLPPTMPVITWSGYSIGRFILGDKYPDFDWTQFRHFSYREMLHFYWPLLLGSLVLGMVCGTVFYFLTLWFLGHRKS